MVSVIHCGEADCGWNGVQHYHTEQWTHPQLGVADLREGEWPDPLYVPGPDEDPQPRTWSATPVNDRKVWFLAAGVVGVVLVLLVWVSR